MQGANSQQGGVGGGCGHLDDGKGRVRCFSNAPYHPTEGRARIAVSRLRSPLDNGISTGPGRARNGCVDSVKSVAQSDAPSRQIIIDTVSSVG